MPKWITINLCLIRVRRAMRAQGHAIKKLQWRAPCGEWGSYAVICVFATVMVCQVVSAILPPVLEEEKDKSRVGLAFQGCLGIIIFSMFYLCNLAYVCYQGKVPVDNRLLIPLDQITLPELEAAASSEEVGETREREGEKV